MKDKKLVLKDGTVFEGISYAADKDFIKAHHMCDLTQCMLCLGCPTSKSFF